MANTSGVTIYWPVASETFSSNLSSTILALAATVPITNLTAYTDGDILVLTVEPGTANQATFIGVKSGSSVISCVWTEGNLAVGHSSGATVIDYDSATHYDVVTKGIRQFANNDGTLKTSAVQAALNISSAVPPDYVALGNAPASVTALGQHSHQMTFAAVDYTDRLNPGTRLRTVRTVAAPNQSTSLNGTSQYWSKTSPNKMAWTDDFAVAGWVKLSSYAAGVIESRYNGTSGWRFGVTSTGQIELVGFNAGAGNFSQVLSYQSVPLNRWVFISAQLDMSTFTPTVTTSYIMIDGVDVPVSVARAGTNPTALIQAGDYQVGAANGALFFPGKIGSSAVFSAKVTQATMLTYMSQGFLGSETSLASGYSFSGNSNDLNTTTPNNLSANGGAITTEADSSFGGQANGTISTTIDYGIVMTAIYSGGNTVVTIQTPEGCTIPNIGGVTSVSYSSAKTPYGFPSQRGKWRIGVIKNSTETILIGSVGAFYASFQQLVVPIGSWIRGHHTTVDSISTVGGLRRFSIVVTDVGAASLYAILSGYVELNTTNMFLDSAGTEPYTTTTQTVSILSGYLVNATGSESYAISERGPSVIYVENALL